MKNEKMLILVNFLCNLIEFQKISNLFCFKKNSENRSFMAQLTWWKVGNTSFCRRTERLKCDNSIRCAKLSQNLVFSTFHQGSWVVKQRFSLHFLKQKRLVVFQNSIRLRKKFTKIGIFRLFTQLDELENSDFGYFLNRKD